MKIVNRVVVVVFVSLCLILRAHAAGETGLSGVVKNSSGPVSGAEIRIQGSDANKIGKVHTKADGRYTYPALEQGTYSVTLLVNGQTRASINNVRTRAGEIQTLNFEILKSSMATPFAPGKHYVWIPSITGSHLGVWAEVQGEGKGMPIGMQERERWAGSALARQIQTRSDDGNTH